MNEKEYSALTDSNYLRKPNLAHSPYTKRIKSVDESNLAMAGKYSPGLKVDSTLCSEQEMKSLCLCGNTKSTKSTDSVCQKEAIADWLKKQITNLKNHIRANMTNEKSKGDILNPDFVLKVPDSWPSPHFLDVQRILPRFVLRPVSTLRNEEKTAKSEHRGSHPPPAAVSAVHARQLVRFSAWRLRQSQGSLPYTITSLLWHHRILTILFLTII